MLFPKATWGIRLYQLALRVKNFSADEEYGMYKMCLKKDYSIIFYLFEIIQ
jgi:hypothetical protein